MTVKAYDLLYEKAPYPYRHSNLFLINFFIDTLLTNYLLDPASGQQVIELVVFFYSFCCQRSYCIQFKKKVSIGKHGFNKILRSFFNTGSRVLRLYIKAVALDYRFYKWR